MSLLEMSGTGAVLILVILFIRAFTLHKLPKLTFSILWGVALLRLLVPFSLPSMLSAYSVLGKAAPEWIPSTVHFNAPAGFTPTATAPQEVLSLVTEPFIQQNYMNFYLFLLWAVGAILCFLYFSAAYFRSIREFRTALPVQSAFAQQWLAAHPFQRPVSIRQSDRISAPLTYGIFRPVILLPKKLDGGDGESEHNLFYILTHESVHIRRFDAVIKLLIAAALCLHWFNPLVWVLYVLMNRDIELLCDEITINLCGMKNKADYARTLIAMEEKKSRLLPLCNHFSKNAIEGRVKAIMKSKKISLFAALLAVVLVAGITMGFATSAELPAGNKIGTNQPETTGSFSQDDFAKLNALRFDGYENMTISAFQQKVWVTRDQPEYLALLERFSHDDKLYQQKDTNETASFLFNVLEPLTAEKWQTWDFSGYVQRDFAQPDPSTLEYAIHTQILNPDSIKVGEFNNTRIEIQDGIKQFFLACTEEELQEEAIIEKKASAEMNRLCQKYQTDSFKVSVLYRSFVPLQISETAKPAQSAEKTETESHVFLTEAEYRSLFSALKAPGYQNKTVSAFSLEMYDWANKNSALSDRMAQEISWGEIRVPLTEEEKSFVSLTCMATFSENSAENRNRYYGYHKENPGLSVSFNKNAEEDGHMRWCQFDYQFSYQMADTKTLTLAERDRRLAGFMNGVQALWDETSLSVLVQTKKEDWAAKLQTLAAQNSSSQLTISVNKDQVFWETQDEKIPTE